MQKLTRTINVTWMLAILFGIVSVQGMECPLNEREQDYTQSALQAAACDANNCLLTKLPRETLINIFSHCIVQSEDQVKSLEKSIKTFMKLSITCKFFNQLLTFETIGNFCKSYTLYVKSTALHSLMQHMSDKTYTIQRLPALILVCAGAYPNIEAYLGHPLIRDAVQHNDTQLVTTLFKHHVDPNMKLRRLTNSTSVIPIFFYAKTVEMAQLFIDNGADVHMTRSNPAGNVLWHIVDEDEYSTELVEFYLKLHVDVHERHPWDNSCLLHAFMNQLKVNNSDDYYRKGTLLLDAMSDIVNQLNNDNQTPLDILYQQLDDDELYEAMLTHIPFYASFRERGGLRAQELAVQEVALLIDQHGGLTAQEHVTKQEEEQRRCTIF